VDSEVKLRIFHTTVNPWFV